MSIFGVPFQVNLFEICWEFYSKELFERPEVDYQLRKEVISEGQTLGLGCVEGAFFCHAVPCAISIHDPEYIPVMLFMQYLTQLEGPFWRQLRGQGSLRFFNFDLSSKLK